MHPLALDQKRKKVPRDNLKQPRQLANLKGGIQITTGSHSPTRISQWLNTTDSQKEEVPFDVEHIRKFPGSQIRVNKSDEWIWWCRVKGKQKSRIFLKYH